MQPRLNFFAKGPEAIKALTGLEQHIASTSIEKPLQELVRLRSSQIRANCYPHTITCQCVND